jgi:Fur family ferric uptake transcriptional regulator
VNCLDTERIIDVHIELPASVIEQVEQQTGIKITDYRIDFFGYSSSESVHTAENTDSTPKAS